MKYAHRDPKATDRPGITIERVWVERITDTNPEEDAISYGNEGRDFAIDREARGDMLSGQYRYYYPPVENYKGLPKKTIREYAEQDYKRAESYNGNEWCYLGIVARAVVSYDEGGGNRRLQRFESGGLWGVESDSEESYLKSTEEDELDALKDHLQKFGVDVADFEARAKEAVRR